MADVAGVDDPEGDDPIFAHPLVHLEMGLIDACTLIVPRAELPTWTAEGWVALPGYADFHYQADEDEMIIARRPDTLAVRGASELIGAEIVGWRDALGSYGMGGPGFFGLLLSPRAGATHREYLAFAAWGSARRVLLDGRVLEAPHGLDASRPWITDGDARGTALDAALIGARIAEADLADDRLRLTLTHGATTHLLEFPRNDARLPPMGSGELRTPAYEEGTLADILVFQPEDAVLWV